MTCPQNVRALFYRSKPRFFRIKMICGLSSNTKPRHLGSFSHPTHIPAHDDARKAPAPCTPPCFTRELPPIIRPFIRICAFRASASPEQQLWENTGGQSPFTSTFQARKPPKQGARGWGHLNHWKSQSQPHTHTHTPTTSWMTPSMKHHTISYFLFGNKVLVRECEEKKK